MLNVTAKFLESKFNGPGGRENLAVGVQGLSKKRGSLQRCFRKGNTQCMYWGSEILIGNTLNPNVQHNTTPLRAEPTPK